MSGLCCAHIPVRSEAPVLIESENTLTRLGAYLREGVLTLDQTDGVIISLPEPAARMLGRSVSELVGSTLRSVLDPSMSSEAE